MITLNLRLPDDVHALLREIAALENRSLNAQIIQAIKEYKNQKEEIDRLRRIIEGQEKPIDN